MVGLVFLPKNVGLMVGPTKTLCCSVNVHGVVTLFTGSGDT